jgi:hypothetical protein
VILLYLLFVFIALIIEWRMIKSPFFGLLFMIAVNPLEALFPLPKNITAGRIVAVMAVIGWFVHLQRHSVTWMRLRKSKLIWMVWVFPAVCIVGVMLSDSFSSSIDGYSSAVKIFLLALMALMIENLVDSKKRMDQLLLVVALSSAVAAIFPFANYFGVDLYAPLGIKAEETVRGMRSSGLTGTANDLGLATSMGLFALISLVSVLRGMRATLSLAALALLMIGGLLLSGSRTHFVAFFVCIFSYGGIRLLGPQKGRLYSLLALVALLALVPFALQKAPEPIQKRFIIIGSGVQSGTIERANFATNQRRQSFDILLDNPLLGLGLQGFQSKEAEGYGTHDTVSALLAETGLLGVLAFSWLVVACWLWLYHGIRTGQKWNFDLYYYSVGFMAGLVAILIAGFGGYVVFYQRWFWITIGTSAVITRWSSVMDEPLSFSESQAKLRRIRGWAAGRAFLRTARREDLAKIHEV